MKRKKFHVHLPRHDVDIYEVEAVNQSQALALAKELRAQADDEHKIGVFAGSRIKIEELPPETGRRR